MKILCVNNKKNNSKIKTLEKRILNSDDENLKSRLEARKSKVTDLEYHIILEEEAYYKAQSSFNTSISNTRNKLNSGEYHN